MKTNSIIYLTVSLIFSSYIVMAQSPLAIQYNMAKEAYKKQDYKAYLFHTSKADSISPNHPTLTYNMASATALTGDEELALSLLKKAVLMNVSLYPTNDADFDNLKRSQSFGEVTKLKNELSRIVSQSVIGFTLEEKDLHPESIVYDPISKSFLISSIHKNKIVQYYPKTGKTLDWKVSDEDGLWAVMGMKRDAKSKALWVCTVATKEMMNYKDELEGKTALLKFDIKSKKLLKRYDLGGGHWFGDVVITNDGTPLISDSMKPIIYTIKDDEIVVFKDFTSKLFNLQGLALNKAGTMLYIADYKIGLHIYNIDTDELQKVKFGENMITKGIDGLYYHKDKLIAIQNGVNPMRVSEYTLDQSGVEITSFKYIDNARKELGEPTLGVIARGTFYYIANSPWGKYDKEGNLKAEELTENIVLKYSLQD